METYSIHNLAVTGATGSIGISVIEECICRNISVTAIYRFSSVNAPRVPDHPLVTRVNCDLAGLKDLQLPGIHCDALLHLAWGSTKSTERNNLVPQVQNIQYALDAVELAHRLGCHTFMGAGSQAEYGQHAENLMEESQPVASYSCDLITSHFSELLWLMEQIMWKKMDERLAEFLLTEASIEGSSQLRITHETIANHLGTHREVVTRMLRYFQSEGMVKLTRGAVEITDEKKLASLEAA